MTWKVRRPRRLSHNLPPTGQLRNNSPCACGLAEKALSMVTGQILRQTKQKKPPLRQVSEPQSENAVRGPRNSFIEDLETNLRLLNKHLPAPDLTREDMTLGRASPTAIALVYLRERVRPELVDEVKRRLDKISVVAVLESGYIEHFIQDSPASPFPQVMVTERPDRVSIALLEGRVAILADNTPFVLVVPGELLSLLQAADDYYNKRHFNTLVKLLRYLALVASLMLPSLYIAITAFHQDMIPSELLINIAAARQGVPFPAILEAVFMEVTFESLREAGIRLPTVVGQTVSIVGALVIGQAAIQAGLVSPLMVIIVAFTGIASFTVPQYPLGQAVRVLRFPLMLTAALLGLFGVMLGLLAILLHLSALRTFGIPYLSPLSPLQPTRLAANITLPPQHLDKTTPSEQDAVHPDQA
ncbi:spore germination protein [Desulfurispora thermophila]|uniref:spore germination protein n=1 Tax=Desulfurispora thermophila TaxID=265470 RepID=UPI000360626E|nr:spore germination protein [Desulfurispora thermophila]